MNQLQIYSSPKNINDNVIRLIGKMGLSNSNPIQVDVRLENDAKPLNCYFNVEEKVKRDGGSIVYGWAILKGDLILEAEHHGIWKSDSGLLYDITPREEINLDSIMFIEDNDRKYENVTIDNIRLNITENRLVDEIILISEFISKLMLLCEYKDGFLYGDESVAKAITFSHRMKDDLVKFVRNGGTFKSRCYCGEDKRYKNCHGQMIKYDLNKISMLFSF